MAATLENPFYYLDNFQHLLEWVAQRYSDLLEADEQRFIQDFFELPQASRGLLVRMVMRKGELFRAGRLDYPEIGASEQAAAPLLALGWLRENPPLALDALFRLLRKDELSHCFPELPRRLGKQQQLAYLATSAPEPRPWRNWYPGTQETLYQLCIMPWCDRLRLMYFGNLQQDWSEFVLADLGIYHYESVDFDAASRAFRQRQDVDLYLELYHCRDAFEQGEPLPSLLQRIPGTTLDNPWLERRRGKLLFSLARQAERLQDWQQALELYRHCGYPGARARQVRVLEQDGQHAQALQLACQALAEPESEQEQQQLQRSLPRLQRLQGLPAAPRATAASAPRLDLCLPLEHSMAGVEAAVAGHLGTADQPVYYVENTLLNALLGLLCWPAIFSNVPGAFFNPYQRGPADLFSADFTHLRQPILAACLARLDDSSYRQAILEHFDSKHGVQSPFVHWELLSRELLELALDCIPARHLRLYIERILSDIRHNRSGLPDLVQFWPGQRRYRLVEVKGPGDRLQDNQIRWIGYCLQHDLPVSVCHVTWQASGA